MSELNDRFKVNPGAQGTPNVGGTNSASQTNDTAKSKPIDFEENKKNDPVLNTISDEEFQKLDPEKQLEQLKKKFPTMSEQDLKATLQQAKTYIAEEKNAQNTTNTTEETNTSNITKQEKEDIEQYFKTYDKSISVKDIYNKLISKTINQLTDTEKNVLKYIQSFKQTDKIRAQILEVMTQDKNAWDNLIPKEKLQSEEWKNLSPQEKLKERADAFLRKNVENYDKFPKALQKTLRIDFYDQIGKQTVPNWNELTAEQKRFQRQVTAVKIELAEQEGLSIKDVLTNTSSEQLNKIIQKYSKNLVNSLLQDTSINVSSEKWKNSTEIEKFNTIVDNFIITIDPKYKYYSQNKKEKIREQWSDHIAKQIYPDWDKYSPEDKYIRKCNFATEIAAMKYSGKSLQEYSKQSIQERVNDIYVYSEENTIEITPELKVMYDTAIRTGEMNVSNKDMIKTLEEKAKTGTLSEAEQKVLENLQLQIEIDPEAADYKNAPSLYNVEKELEKFDGDYNKYLTQIAQDNNLKNPLELKNTPEGRNLIKGLFKSCNEQKTINNLAKCLQISEDELTQYIDTSGAIKNAASALMNKDTDSVTLNTRILHKHGKENAVSKTIHLTPKYIEDQTERLKFGVEVAKLDKKYSEDVAASWNNTDFVSTEEAIELARGFNMSDEVADGSKAIFTEALIETAQNDNIRINYSKELSKINNPAVTEGLAAGSDSIENPDLLNKYNSYIEQALENYPPQQQQNIRSAMQTGEITQNTLSQTTPKETDTNNYDNNTNIDYTNNQNQEILNKTNASSAPTNDYTNSFGETNRTSYNNQTEKITSISDSPIKAEKNKSEASTISYNTEKINNETTKALNDKKEALKENLAKTQEKIEKEIAEENAKNTAITEEDIQVIEKELNNIEELTITEQDKIKQVFKKAGKNINAIYTIIMDKYGTQAQDKFLEILASNGTSDSIRSFVNSMKSDSSIIKKLYTHCNNQKIKTELLGLLPTDDIIAMISAGKISNYNDIDHKILYAFLIKNMSSMSNTSFSSYLQYLSLDEREKLIELRNNTGSKKSQNEIDPLTSQATNRQNINTNNNEVNNNNKKTEETDTINPDKKLEDNETSKMLNDGTIIRRKETFAGVSNNTYEEYEEVSPVSENPSPATAAIPGSSAWYQEYNKQAVATEPTFADNYGEEYSGISLGSNKFANKRPLKRINKKGPFIYKA